MKKTVAVKEIKETVAKLNAMDNKLVFSYEETEDYVGLVCKSKTSDSARFGAYEYMGFFDEFVNKADAYITCMLFARVILAASKINDKKAYHNLAF